MKRRLHYIISLLVSALVFGCEEVVILDIDQAPPALVIDAMVTNQFKSHYVRVTHSGNFYGGGGLNVVDAIVEVSDDQGNRFTYTHNPLGYDSLQGYYFADAEYAGKIGGVYHLNVEIGNSLYTATDTLRPITDIDSLSVRIAPDLPQIPKEDDKIYQVLLYAAEPQETADFYYFKFYRDGVIEVTDNIYVFDDRVLGPTLDGLPSPVLFREGEYASVEIYSLTREQYVYFTDLENLLNSDGGMFSPPPANPRTNISGGALGLFQVSAVTKASILITP